MKTRVSLKYFVNDCSSVIKKFLNLDYNGSNSFLFVNTTKIYQVKAKHSEINNYTLCLGNISKDFTIKNLKKKTGLKGTVKL